MSEEATSTVFQQCDIDAAVINAHIRDMKLRRRHLDAESSWTQTSKTRCRCRNISGAEVDDEELEITAKMKLWHEKK